jgi:hypothetical protein
MLAGSTLPGGVSLDYRSKTTLAAALRLTIKPEHVTSIATLTNIYHALDSSDGALVADCPLGVIISSMPVRRALQAFTWREGPGGEARSYSLVPPRADDADYTVKEFWLQLRKVVRPSISSTLAKIVALAASLDALTMASGDYSRGLLSLVSLLVAAAAFYDPTDLYLADLAPTVMRTLSNVSLTSQVRAAVGAASTAGLTHCASHDLYLSTMLAVFRDYATDHLAIATEAQDHDVHRPPGPAAHDSQCDWSGEEDASDSTLRSAPSQLIGD